MPKAYEISDFSHWDFQIFLRSDLPLDKVLVKQYNRMATTTDFHPAIEETEDSGRTLLGDSDEDDDEVMMSQSWCENMEDRMRILEKEIVMIKCQQALTIRVLKQVDKRVRKHDTGLLALIRKHERMERQRDKNSKKENSVGSNNGSLHLSGPINIVNGSHHNIVLSEQQDYLSRMNAFGNMRRKPSTKDGSLRSDNNSVLSNSRCNSTCRVRFDIPVDTDEDIRLCDSLESLDNVGEEENEEFRKPSFSNTKDGTKLLKV